MPGGKWGKWSELLTLNTILGSNLRGPLDAARVAAIPHGHICTGFSQATSYGKTDASTGACNDGSLALQ